MKAKPVRIAGVRYPSIEALRRAVNAAVASGTIDTEFVRGLVDRHPYAEVVRGDGIERAEIEVRRNGPCIVITRVDGSRMALCRDRCIDENEHHRFAQSCRGAAFESVQAWRAARFASGEHLTCALTGDALTPETADADHVQPWTFATIVAAFRMRVGTAPTRAKSSDYDCPVFVDAEVAAAFRAFHDDRAVLRLVSRDLNRGAWRWRA